MTENAETGPERAVHRDPTADPRLADDRDIVYIVMTDDGRKFRWTGTPDLVNQKVKVLSGPMLLLADDGTLLNFAHVVSMEPLHPARTEGDDGGFR